MAVVPVARTTPRRAAILRPSTSTRPGPHHRRPASDEATTVPHEPVDRHLVVPVVGGFGADPVGDLRPVRGDGGLAGQSRHAGGLRDQPGRPNHHLARDASPVGAFTADQLALDPDDVESRCGELACDGLTSDPQSDHHHVHGLIGC